CRTGGGRLPASGHGPQRRLRPGARSHAARPPRRLAAQATADRYSPGWRPASTSRLLPRRIHLPLQSPQIKGPRAALSSPRPTSPRRWTRALQRHRQATGFQRLPDNGAMKGIPIIPQMRPSRDLPRKAPDASAKKFGTTRPARPQHGDREEALNFVNTPSEGSPWTKAGRWRTVRARPYLVGPPLVAE